MSTSSQRVNTNHFSTEKFPEVIAFCERDDSSHVTAATEESYTYTLNGQTIYTLKKVHSQWELMEMNGKNVVRVSTGKSLGMVLWHALRFSEADKGKQEERVNILLPVAKADLEKALAFMYYYGGYPGNFLEHTPELDAIMDRFVDPNITILSYSYVPVTHLDWLREILKTDGLIPEGATNTLWIYKK